MNPNSDGPFDDETFDIDDVSADVATQFLKGGALAAAIVAGPIIAIYLIYLVGLLLPPESKQAPDPTPDSFSQLQVERSHHV
ncbi:MAG: RC-LH1 core complex protein PufX [Pseudomonadota bacterium]